MILSLITISAQSSGAGGGSSLMGFVVPMLLIVLIFYFLMIRPQVKRQKEQKAMIDALRKGDSVIAAGGVIGTVAGIKDKENIIILKVDDNVKIEILKSSVSTVIRKE